MGPKFGNYAYTIIFLSTDDSKLWGLASMAVVMVRHTSCCLMLVRLYKPWTKIAVHPLIGPPKKPDIIVPPTINLVRSPYGVEDTPFSCPKRQTEERTQDDN